MRNYVNVSGRYTSFPFLPQESLIRKQHGVWECPFILFPFPLMLQLHVLLEFLILITGIMAGRMSLGAVPARRPVVRHERTVMPFHSIGPLFHQVRPGHPSSAGPHPTGNSQECDCRLSYNDPMKSMLPPLSPASRSRRMGKALI